MTGARAILCGLAFGFFFAGPANAAEKTATPGMTYPSLSALPDWSGWWGVGQALTSEYLKNPPPMPARELARYRQARAQDSDADPTRYCRPNQFVGFSGGFVDAVEFLFSPGRVTLTNEAGLVRRIYTDGRALPREYENTNTGTSIGHWEGGTLVVETLGINPAAKYPGPHSGAIPVGKNVMITERIALKDQNTLEFEVVTVAPDILTAPDRRKRIYSRLPKHEVREVTFCVDFDRAIDPKTGKQRFDMTPPADLAPPPSK